MRLTKRAGYNECDGIRTGYSQSVYQNVLVIISALNRFYQNALVIASALVYALVIVSVLNRVYQNTLVIVSALKALRDFYQY